MNDKYVFLDRDGVINKDPGGWTEYSYVTSLDELKILPGSPEAIKKLTDAGFKVVIISNQQGIGKGYFTEEDLNKVTSEIIRRVDAAGGHIEKVYYCVHLADDNCNCRKPKPGLFYKAQEDLGVSDISGRYYIGDTERDIQAGQEADLRTILVLTGKNSREDAEAWEHRPDHICEDLLAAVDLVIDES